MALRGGVAAVLLLACLAGATADVHAPKKLAVEHVAILMVDGLHAVDLDNYVAEFPNSAIAGLLTTGVKYNQYYLPPPTDSWPALATQITGAGPEQHGIIYESPYSRGLYPPGSNCSGNPGTPVDYAEDSTNPITALTDSTIDPSFLPRNKSLGCTPVYPNNWILVNTMFGVATGAGLKTGWSDKALQYNFVAGPGNPLDLSDRITEFKPWSIDYLINKKDIPSQIEYDLLHMNTVHNWIAGKYANGTATADGKPFNLFGTSLQALNAAQKSADTTANGLTGPNGQANVYLSGGYGIATAIPNDPTKTNSSDPQLNTKIAATLNKNNVNNTNNDWFLAEVHTAFQALDAIVGQTVNALKNAGLYDKTVLVLTSKHGNSPIDHSTLVRVDPKAIASAINKNVIPGIVASFNADTGYYLWLNNNTAANVAAVVAFLNTPANLAAFHTSQVLSGAALQAILGTQADRIPDIFIVPNTGVVYTTSLAKVADHGGMMDDDTHLATIFSGPMLTPGVVNDRVSAAQLAVTALDLLGVDYTKLQGAAAEGTKPLPGLSGIKVVTDIHKDVADAITQPVTAGLNGAAKVVNDVLG